jgi:hypothetical protein
MDIQFDENGYIKPYNTIDFDLETFEQIFVYNSHRRKLFETYMKFKELLDEMPIGNYSQWIDGSFVTRFAYPRDIDLVCFVNFDFHRKFEQQLIALKKSFKQQGLDIYFETAYPKSHNRHFLTIFQENKWREIYGFDRRDRRKGFIQIKFQHGN